MALLRKQYHSRHVGRDTHVWDVHKLIRASRALPVLDVAISQIAELDENWWFSEPDQIPTPRALATHVRLVQAVDMHHPVILCADGRLMDGMHLVVRAVMEERTHIRAVQFTTTPPPDFVNVRLDDLPYPDEDI